jgi:hypothetical protein
MLHSNTVQTPIYDIYDGTASGNYKMYNDSLSYHYTNATERNADNTITVSGTCLPDSPLLLIGIKDDSVGIISSPVYDTVVINYILDNQSNAIFIVFGTSSSALKHWHLRNDEFTVMNGDNTQTVSPITTLNTKTYNGTTYYGVNVSLDWSISIPIIYIIDVLGVRYSPSAIK